MDWFKGINPFAMLVLLTVIALVLTDKIDPQAFLTFVSGLAIPARQDGYQSIGTRPTPGTPDKPIVVEGIPGGEPVPVADRPAAKRRRS